MLATAFPSRSDALPPLRAQIEDHIRAYLVVGECSMSVYPCYQILFKASREGPSVICGPRNRVADLPYRSPEVDDAVHEVMTAEMSRGLRLHPVLTALFYLAQGDPDRYCPGGVEGRLHGFVHDVPFLWEGLVQKVARRLGCVDCGAIRGEPEVSRSQMLAVLDVLEKGYSSPGGNWWRGLPALQSTPYCDPNLAVAIARTQRGMAGVPSTEEVEEELRRMRVRLVP